MRVVLVAQTGSEELDGATLTGCPRVCIQAYPFTPISQATRLK